MQQKEINTIKEEFKSINMDVLDDYPKRTLSDVIRRIYKIING